MDAAVRSIGCLDWFDRFPGPLDNLEKLAGLIPEKPARALQPGFRGNRGTMPVLLKDMSHESGPERDFLLTLMFDDRVRAVAAQPVTIPCKAADGRSTRYTPDYLVIRDGARPTGHMVEIKEVAELKSDWKLLKPRLKAGCSYAREHGLGFLLVTDRQIYRFPIRAMHFLVSYRDHPDDESIEQHLIHRLAGIGPATPRKLLAAAFQSECNQIKAIPFLWKLIARQRICAELGKEVITMATPIWIDKKSDWRRVDPYSHSQAVRSIARRDR